MTSFETAVEMVRRAWKDFRSTESGKFRNRLPASQAADRLAQIGYTPSDDNISIAMRLARSERRLNEMLPMLQAAVGSESMYARKAQRLVMSILDFLDPRTGTLHRTLHRWPPAGASARNSLVTVAEILDGFLVQCTDVLTALEKIDNCRRHLQRLDRYARSLPSAWATLIQSPNFPEQLHRACSNERLEHITGDIVFAETVLASDEARLALIPGTLATLSGVGPSESDNVESRSAEAIGTLRRAAKVWLHDATEKISDSSAGHVRWLKGHTTAYKRHPKRLQTVDESIERVKALRREGARRFASLPLEF